MQTEQTTAKIYQFPVRGRNKIGSMQSNTAPVADDRKAPAVTVCGDAWYHDAAIAEAQTPVKH